MLRRLIFSLNSVPSAVNPNDGNKQKKLEWIFRCWGWKAARRGRGQTVTPGGRMARHGPRWWQILPLRLSVSVPLSLCGTQSEPVTAMGML
jgi:hypothetical protein